MTGCFLDVAEPDTGVESGSDERMPQRVRLEDASLACDPTHDPCCAVTIQTNAVAVAQDRTAASFADRGIDCSHGSWRERDGHGFATLRCTTNVR